ncbi:MAG: ABC transporter ATP-binding protein [Planctomycetota bacterium]
MSTVITVDSLSKAYRLGLTHAGSVRDLVNGTIGRLLGRGAPKPTVAADDSDRIDEQNNFWALRDVSFQVGSGEIVGVIGRNGAGKSTLLKILSRVTLPTAGYATMNGRVASLLEVGTGFHPELTGRENVFMNGTILGMSRKEVSSKIDDIVEFAGVSDFLDTPVKRYSSGMTVRLGFAVAAHLDPEILIVDEVLAVGDAKFQNRCIEKMNDVAKNDNRTVLVVSHNMGTISSLCDSALILDGGRAGGKSDTLSAINEYLHGSDSRSAAIYELEGSPSDDAWIQKAWLQCGDDHSVSTIPWDQDFIFHLQWENQSGREVMPSVSMENEKGVYIFTSVDTQPAGNGRYHSRFVFPGQMLNAGLYSVHLGIDGDTPPHCYDSRMHALHFQLDMDTQTQAILNPFGKSTTHLTNMVNSRWETDSVDSFATSSRGVVPTIPPNPSSDSADVETH